MALTEVDVARLNDDVFAATGPNKNRIINGDMRIDQRNAGASITQSTSALYPVDRWAVTGNIAGKFTAQQNANAVTPPPGYTHYLGITSSSSYTVSGNDSFQLYQIIEGLNASDFAWGTANAVPATLSFWVRSSLTGTFGGSLASTKTTVWVLPFSYTISSADTWTYVTIPIPAATSTSGINTDNSAGIFVRFGLGSSGTATGGTTGTWTDAGNYIQPSGTTSVVGTNGATFYITGVQLEAGDTATPFERRSYGQELALCQRYCPVFDASISFNGTAAPIGNAFANTTTTALCVFSLPVQTRVPPTGITASAGSHFAFSNGVGSFGGGTLTFAFGSCYAASIVLTASSGTVSVATGGYLYALNSAGKIIFNGCEL